MNPSSRLARRRGVAGLEFALVVPVLALLALATVDLVTYIRAFFRLEQVAAQLSEVITQCQTVNTPGDTNRFETEAQLLAGGFNITAANAPGSFIVTAIVTGSTGASPTIAWQFPFGNYLVYGSAMCGGTTTCASGAAATVPYYKASSAKLPPNQVLIATEVAESVAPFMFSAKLWSLFGNSPVGATVLHLNSFFLVRSANPLNLSKVASLAAQGCGS